MSARLWDVATGQPLSPPLLHEDWILGAAFSPDGKLVATGAGSGEARARIWEVPTGKLHTASMQHVKHDQSVTETDNVYSGAFTPDGRNLLTTSSQYSQLWDVATGKPSAPPVKHPSDTVGSSSLSPNGKTFVVRLQADSTASSMTPPWARPLVWPSSTPARSA